MANGNGMRTVGKQGTLSSLGLDVASKRRKGRPRSTEQTDIQGERRMDLQQRAELQGKLGTETSVGTAPPPGAAEAARTKRKNVKKNGDALRRQGGYGG